MLKIVNAKKIFNLTENVEDIRIALNNLNLEIEDGEFVTIIGGNGSGKSTLMNCISGAYFLDEGKIYLDNKDISMEKEYQRAKYLGRVFQDPNMGTAKDMSIIENLMIASRRSKNKTLKWGFDSKKYQEFKDKLAMLDLGLENRLDSKVGLLSGGQRQAVTLIMATLEKPKLLLLDEHTAALDPKTARKVLEITDKIVTENNITTLMITHNMKDAIKYGNRLIMLNNGRIVFDVKGEEKKNLTIEQLLSKFEDSIDDKLVLG
ncbi:MAG: ATP-binding cassette domain-containing protein [Bacilli bacterium]|nr:ATP-binding cassette domain-containing protein [Bacilli bacterium]